MDKIYLSNILLHLKWVENFDDRVKFENLDYSINNILRCLYLCKLRSDIFVGMDYGINETEKLMSEFPNTSKEYLTNLAKELWSMHIHQLETYLPLTDDHLELFNEYDVLSVDDWHYLLVITNGVNVDRWYDIDYMSDYVRTIAEDLYDEQAEDLDNDIEYDENGVDISGYQYMKHEKSNEQMFDVDELLDKINEYGIESLTEKERMFLENN